MIVAMRKRTNYLSCLILLPLLMHSQLKDPEVSLSEYFKFPRESVYVHLNKSTYVEGDEIWFSGYVYDRLKGLPFTKTSNIRVGVYDAQGVVKIEGLHLVNDGQFKGNFPIDSTFANGDYYVRATTKWMKNFREDDSFVQKITVVDPLSGPSVDAVTEMTYDVQFLPEGGNLIAGIYNNVGVKALNNHGYGIKLSAVEVYDSKGNRITVFDTSRFGMAKFELRPVEGRSYRAKVRLPNGKEQWYDLSKATARGINIKLNLNPHQGRIGVVFAMNEATYDQVGSDGHYFLLHKDGASKKVPIIFDSKDFKATFFLKDDDLKIGVNTITLFNASDRPILERMFFASEGLKYGEPGIQLTSIEKDSIRLSLTSNMEDLRLSLSILPAGSLSYGHRNNILSTFHLKPYVRGFVENPKYYFTDMDKRKAYELDLLLLTQGWSRYRWQDISLGPPDVIYPFEDGIALRATLNGLNPKFKGNLMLYGTKYHGQQLLPVSPGENQFLIKPFFPENGEELYFTLLDEKGRTSKPRGYFKLLNEKLRERINVPQSLNSIQTPIKMEDLPIRRAQMELIKENTVLLDEVTVVEDKPIPVSQAHSNVYIPAFIKNKVTFVDQDMVRNNIFLEDYLRRFYNVAYDRFGNLLIGSWRGTGVTVILDDAIGIPLQGRIPMGQIEAIWIDRLSRYLGARNNRLGEALYIYTKRGKEILPYDEPKNKVYALAVENGFKDVKEFYVPKYSTFESQAYQEYGIVHWEPEILIDKNEMQEISLLNTGKEQIQVFVEGMSKNGELISFSKVINVENNQ